MIASVIKEEPLLDRLTDLPNRALMLDHLNHALERTKLANGPGFALLFLSLDRFSIITDSLGRGAGEKLLISVAERLAASTRSGDAVARLGGHEFALLLDGIQDAEGAKNFADHVQDMLLEAHKLDDYEVYTSASIGMALSASGYSDPADILRDAEIANHRAVARGGACGEIFEPGLRHRVVALLDMETKLRQAVVKGQDFEVHYQPIVALASGRLSGFEALVRMRRADGTLVLPGEFIPLTEETGLIVHIGCWVLNEACRQMHAWQMKFPMCESLQMSVNLAGRQLAQTDLVKQIEQSLESTGLGACSLKLEVTETVIMQHAEAAAAMLAELRDKGIRLLMDDFGTGYSSLSYLHRFPINTIKIDASFVRRMDIDSKNTEIIQTIVALAHTLGMDLVAEGVETENQLAQLRALNVEYGQGYYFAKPLDAAAAEALISAWPQW